MSFDISAIPHEFPRRFLPKNAEFNTPDGVAKYFDTLHSRQLRSKKDLEDWLSDESELGSALAEEQTVRYIRMTCQTDDPAREKAYLDFVENLEPIIKKKMFELDKQFLEAKPRKELPHDRFWVLNRQRENNVALFREENIELEKEETILGQKYQKTTGAWTVSYDGKERTMQQMAQYLEETDRSVREKTWTLAEKRRAKDRDDLDKLYDEMLVLRARIAKNAGFDNYRDYMFKRLNRFDYTPKDCFNYHLAVEKHIVPLMRQIDERRARNLGVSTLRPWDLVVDSKGRKPLRPFKDSAELVQGVKRVFTKVHPDLAKNFDEMARLNLLDLDSRKGKAPGGYNSELMEIRLPFIFMNSVGRETDLRTLLHESGHAFHVFATRNANLHWMYRERGVPIEFAEVASQGMDFIAGEHLEGVFYDHDEAMRSMQENAESTIRLLAWVATIDAFQHWVYTNPGHSIEQRREQWVKLKERFGGGESYAGYEDVWRSRWQRQLHLYLVPFYYIEYGIALLGALGIWTRYRKDPAGALKAYMHSLTFGGSKPLPELFKSAGVPFDFGPSTVEPYAKELGSVLMKN